MARQHGKQRWGGGGAWDRWDRQSPVEQVADSAQGRGCRQSGGAFMPSQSKLSQSGQDQGIQRCRVGGEGTGMRHHGKANKEKQRGAFTLDNRLAAGNSTSCKARRPEAARHNQRQAGSQQAAAARRARRQLAAARRLRARIAAGRVRLTLACCSRTHCHDMRRAGWLAGRLPRRRHGISAGLAGLQHMAARGSDRQRTGATGGHWQGWLQSSLPPLAGTQAEAPTGSPRHWLEQAWAGG